MAETVDMIAGRERGHTTPYLFDRSGHVSPGDQESRLANAAETGGSHQHRFAANEMPVPRVRTAGPHPHQHLRLTDGRRVDLDKLQYVMGSAVLMLDDRLHHPSLQDPGQLAEPKGHRRLAHGLEITTTISPWSHRTAIPSRRSSEERSVTGTLRVPIGLADTGRAVRRSHRRRRRRFVDAR